MGSKNRILLGFITSMILHNMRNIFLKNELHITKNKYNKIIEKHPEIKDIINEDFQVILNNTFATCDYDKDGLYNFISIIDSKYIIYSISTNNFYIEVATVFFGNKRILKKCSKSARYFNDQCKVRLLEYLN